MRFRGRPKICIHRMAPLPYMRSMPYGNPKRPTMMRLDPARVAAVQALGVPLTQAVEEGLDLWLARAKRRKAKPDPLAKHLAPPIDRERAAQAGSHAMPLPPDAPHLDGKKLT